MSALTWLCVFLSVGLLNVQGKKDEICAIADDPVVSVVIALEKQFHEYIDANDKAGLISLYADDAIVAADGFALVEGIEEVSKNLDWFESVTIIRNPDTHVIPLGASKEYVLEMHTSDVSFKDGSENKKEKVAIIWKKVRNEYKVFFEMINDGY